MSDPYELGNALARFFRAVDERAWDTARAAMTAPVHLDYSSFGAGAPADLDPDLIIAGWAELLPGFERTHHQLGNLELTPGESSARVRCYGTATHVIGPEVWTVVGSYDVKLVRVDGRWLIRSLRFEFKYQAGALDLPARARARLAQDAEGASVAKANTGTLAGEP